MKDYSKAKHMPQKEGINSCPHCGHAIGDIAEGEHPVLPDVKDINSGDQHERGTHDQYPFEKDDGTIDLLPDTSSDNDIQEEGKRKKRKDDAKAIFASVVAKEFGHNPSVVGRTK